MHPKGSIDTREMCRQAREEKQRHSENDRTTNSQGSNVVTSRPETLRESVVAVGDQESSASSAGPSKRAESGQAQGLQDSGNAPSKRPSKKLKKDPKLYVFKIV